MFLADCGEGSWSLFHQALGECLDVESGVGVVSNVCGSIAIVSYAILVGLRIFRVCWKPEISMHCPISEYYLVMIGAICNVFGTFFASYLAMQKMFSLFYGVGEVTLSAIVIHYRRKYLIEHKDEINKKNTEEENLINVEKGSKKDKKILKKGKTESSAGIGTDYNIYSPDNSTSKLFVMDMYNVSANKDIENTKLHNSSLNIASEPVKGSEKKDKYDDTILKWKKDYFNNKLNDETMNRDMSDIESKHTTHLYTNQIITSSSPSINDEMKSEINGPLHSHGLLSKPRTTGAINSVPPPTKKIDKKKNTYSLIERVKTFLTPKSRRNMKNANKESTALHSPSQANVSFTDVSSIEASILDNIKQDDISESESEFSQSFIHTPNLNQNDNNRVTNEKKKSYNTPSLYVNESKKNNQPQVTEKLGKRARHTGEKILVFSSLVNTSLQYFVTNPMKNDSFNNGIDIVNNNKKQFLDFDIQISTMIIGQTLGYITFALILSSYLPLMIINIKQNSSPKQNIFLMLLTLMVWVTFFLLIAISPNIASGMMVLFELPWFLLCFAQIAFTITLYVQFHKKYLPTRGVKI